MISATRSASSPAAGSWSRTPSSRVRAAATAPEGVGVALVGRQRLARRLGSRAQRVGVAEPPLLVGQRGVLARLRATTASISASPNRSRSASRARSRAWATTSASSRSTSSSSVCRRPVGGEQARDLGTAVGVQRVALGARPEQAVLVGLPVHRHQRLGHLRQLGDRHRGTAHERPRPPLGRHVAGEQHLVALDLAPDASTACGHAGQVGRPGPRPRPGRSCCPTARPRCRPGRRAAGPAR